MLRPIRLSPILTLSIPVSLALCACSDDEGRTYVLPDCDDLDWPLGLEFDAELPPPEFAVECAMGWGNTVETRPALDTIALPSVTGDSVPHPDGGWIFVVAPEYQPGWIAWLEKRGVGVSPSTLPGTMLLHYTDDNDLGWIVSEFVIWNIDLVGEELWAVGRDRDDQPGLLVFDPATGEQLDAGPWDTELQFNQLEAARDPAGGVWITAIGHGQENGQVEQALYRAKSVDALELVASRHTEDQMYWPSGGIDALPDGAVAWRTEKRGFEIVDPDGSVRWTHPIGTTLASDGDTALVLSRAPTYEGDDVTTLILENVELSDGTPLWTRQHRRFEVADPENCHHCMLVDLAYPVLRPDGGYLLVGRAAYPSSSCPGQPLLMAVSADGVAEWAHRIDICGRTAAVAFRDGSKLETLGHTYGETTQIDAWRRWFDL
jgi:hypothetical protein